MSFLSFELTKMVIGCLPSEIGNTEKKEGKREKRLESVAYLLSPGRREHLGIAAKRSARE